MNDYEQKGLISLLGLWLLFHEVADDWIKELVRSGQSSPEESRNALEDLAQKVNSEKENVKSYLAEKGLTSPSGQNDVILKSLEDLQFKIEEIGNRLTVIERDIDVIKGLKAEG